MTRVTRRHPCRSEACYASVCEGGPGGRAGPAIGKNAAGSSGGGGPCRTKSRRPPTIATRTAEQEGSDRAIPRQPGAGNLGSPSPGTRLSRDPTRGHTAGGPSRRIRNGSAELPPLPPLPARFPHSRGFVRARRRGPGIPQGVADGAPDAAGAGCCGPRGCAGNGHNLPLLLLGLLSVAVFATLVSVPAPTRPALPPPATLAHPTVSPGSVGGLVPQVTLHSGRAQASSRDLRPGSAGAAAAALVHRCRQPRHGEPDRCPGRGIPAGHVLDSRARGRRFRGSPGRDRAPARRGHRLSKTAGACWRRPTARDRTRCCSPSPATAGSSSRPCRSIRATGSNRCSMPSARSSPPEGPGLRPAAQHAFRAGQTGPMTPRRLAPLALAGTRAGGTGTARRRMRGG